MDICVVGAGYVGLTQAAVLADLGHTVSCIDTDHQKVAALTKGEVPIYEPGLKEMIEKNRSSLFFTTSILETLEKSPIVFIAVGTPSAPDGQTDLTYVESVVDQIAKSLQSYTTIITKSTVPPGTNQWIYETLIEKGADPNLFEVVSNPEFLKEGTAIMDMLHADRIVIGKRDSDQRSVPILKEIYKEIESPYVVTTLAGAEMIKYASNAFLATKISFINEIARICDEYEVNVGEVATGIGLDPRISPDFLQAGIGYGGSCFPKDVRSLEHSALKKQLTPIILQAVQEVNKTQVDVYIDKLKSRLGDLSLLSFTVLGIAFKPNTDDTRYSAAVRLIERLADLGSKVHTYDPEARLPFTKEHVTQHDSLKAALEGADCTVIATEWKEFREMDWSMVKKWMKGNWVMDARNCLNPKEIESQGMRYIGVGHS